jgi:hypothetical protein
LGRKWATPKRCKWRNANGHATWWRKETLMGEGKG